MESFSALLSQGTAHAWLFIPTAILLGAMHGLEPGHSKTMMAAFIVAIRGTVSQAVLLGLCATFSHTLIVWVIALGGLYLWRGVAPEAIEPYLQLASAVIIIGMGAWMVWRVRREQALAARGDHHHRDHSHDERLIDTGHGLVRLEIVEDGRPARFRVSAEGKGSLAAGEVAIETERPDGTWQKFAFREAGGSLESVEDILEPHEFMARISLRHGTHVHEHDVAFIEHEHGHDHIHEELRGLDVSAGYQDAHELAHANDIRRRFADRNVTTAQIAIFGLTGGLIPCPGAITVLLLCLQLGAFALGAALVLCFSIGLALTMVASGVIAAISVRHASARFSSFGEIVRKAPYVSAVVILAIGLYLGINGWAHLPA